MTSEEEPVPQEPATVPFTSQTIPRTLATISETRDEAEATGTKFHQNADLQVIIKTTDINPIIYLACASALACASVVWRTMVYHDDTYVDDAYRDSKKGQVQTIRLDGDPEAIGLLFHIIHYEFNHVPENPTLDQLFELGKSACQFRCTHILYPWAAQWTTKLSEFAFDDNCYSKCHKALYVAWTFGDLKLYRDMVDALIVSTEINTDGKIVNISGMPLEDMLIPCDLLDIITTTRASTIKKILDVIKKPIHDLTYGKQGQKSTYCKVGKDSQGCEIMMLGSTIPALTQAGLFPTPEPEKFTGSIVQLKEKVEKIKTIPYVGKEWAPHMSHEGCNLGFRDSVTVCLNDMEVPLSSSIMSWISNQAKTCGVEPTRELEEWQRK
ncbi:hypothetical protein F5B22DRAFT_640387 [Xylaria bambusicola]|uniref:uncharacterized protein n=1 Tax=Xylaria bambusicola TaxID=326684 RepID=UPI00200871B8|nr:uncharacterized protein F5B22DRAFT_640387 [Xylaria bambusicola]KAI0503133.1 hypothetical protein F5B22DRAFT_640387 [Xylaria bambusicola]